MMLFLLAALIALVFVRRILNFIIYGDNFLIASLLQEKKSRLLTKTHLFQIFDMTALTVTPAVTSLAILYLMYTPPALLCCSCARYFFIL